MVAMPARYSVNAALLAIGAAALFGCRTPEEECEEDLRLARKAISKLDYRLAESWRDKAATHCSDAERVKKLTTDIDKLRARRAKR
jgi:hypothetical protein